jgi:5-methylcytosine-specific restriction protein A
MPTLKRGSARYKPGNERKVQERRLTDNSEVYNGQRWRKVRLLALADSQGLCVSCLANGLVTQAKEVDHITPISQGGAVYDLDNLQPLCVPCHARKSGKEAHLGRGV